MSLSQDEARALFLAEWPRYSALVNGLARAAGLLEPPPAPRAVLPSPAAPAKPRKLVAAKQTRRTPAASAVPALWERITAAVGREYGVEPSLVASGERNRSASRPRAVAYHLLHLLSGVTGTQLAALLGRSQTVVCRAIRTIPALARKDRQLAERLAALEAKSRQEAA